MQVVADLCAEVFVGVDWASDDHAVCVVDDAGRNQATFSITHSREGFDRLVARLAALGEPNRVPVALERPDGRLVDRLLEADFRWACNTRFRRAITTFADNSRHESPWAAAIYQAAIDRGCDHPHAERILARAWIRVIYRCWIDRTPYDPARHGGARRLELTHGRREVA